MLEFNLLKTEARTSFKIQGSGFISYGIRCESQQEFEERLGAIKREHYNATHHCTGWRINPFDPLEFSQDDGEPPGTAGLPVLNQLRAAEVINAGIVVVRYYGGTKLGKPGLIQAYGDAARSCIESCGLEPAGCGVRFRITFPYEQQNLMARIAERFAATQTDASYTEKVELQLDIPETESSAFSRLLGANAYLGVQTERIGQVIIKKS